MSRAVVAILGIVLVGVLGVYGFQAALADAGDDQTITDEQFTPDAGTIQELEQSNRTHAYYDDTVEVYNGSDTRMIEGVDYVWYDNNGTIEPIAGGGLDGETNAYITYNFSVTTQEQRTIASLAATLPQALGVLIPLLGVALLFAFLKG